MPNGDGGYYSCSCPAAAVIGVRVDYKKATTKSYYYNDYGDADCKHDGEKTKFCSKCGNEREVRHKWLKQLSGMEKYCAVGDHWKPKKIILAAESVFVNDTIKAVRMLPVPDMEKLEAATRHILQPLGLWNEAQWGIWAISGNEINEDDE